MAVTESQMTQLGQPAPTFTLPTANPNADDLEGGLRSLDDYAEAEALVIVFMCNHCPYVKHVEDALIAAAREYQERNVQFIGICSNDVERYPDDSFERMADRARDKGYPFPYLHDESQDVARSYQATCTPDFFVYDNDRTLVYRGRFDETRPNQGKATGRDLRQALDELLDDGTVHIEQKPSMGCNIKWKPGKEPVNA